MPTSQKKVISSHQIYTEKGEMGIECTMDDFSVWQCDMNGENWVQKKLGDDALTEKYNAFVPKQE